MDFENLFPENLYHSYVVEANPDHVAHSLFKFLETRGEVNRNSPDAMISVYDSFTVTDGELVKEWHKSKPIDGKKKICILGVKFINREAEQSLLKIIEEPNDHTHFFIVIPDSSVLLDTILSRVHVIKINDDSDNEDDLFAENFLKLSASKRIDKIGEIIKEFKDEEGSGGLRFKAISILNGIENIVYEEWKKDVSDEDKKFILNEIKECREYLNTPGSSVKMILEHIALVI